MRIYAIGAGGVLEDTFGRDWLYAKSGPDIYTLNRDGQLDSIVRFDLSLDKIDISAFNVTWDEVEVKFEGGRNYSFTIRGEKTTVRLDAPQEGEIYDYLSLSEEYFIFNDGAAAPAPRVILDEYARNKLSGTDQPDVFIMHEDGIWDAIKRFDPMKDKIDLSGFSTSFEDLEISTPRDGKIIIQLATERLIVFDISSEMRAEDYTEDMFIF